MIPSLEDLHAFELKGFKLSVIVVDLHKDKKVSMLQQLALTLPKGLTLNLAVVIKKIRELELSYVKGAWEEIYKMHNEGIQMLGQIKHGFCHPLAILFKVPADMVGIDCRLMVGLPKESRELERTDSHRHVIFSRIRNINLLYNLLPGEPNVANVAWGRNKNAPTAQSTPTSRLYLSHTRFLRLRDF
ncbi:hypothetical protein HanPI659440_Chr06g0240991 [Helianthus annuus]|nr:hypothetical protein HanPI659440_Chr06g0240991 [Helianthus annuus]